MLRHRAERLAEAPQMPPADRQPHEFFLRADRELQRRGQVGEVPAALDGAVRRGHRRVDHDVRPARACQGATARRVVARDDRPHPFALQHQDHRQADRPAADHDRDRALADVAAADCVEPDRHRLGQRRDVGRQAIRDCQHQRLLDQQLLGVGAGRVGRQADRVDPFRRSQQRQRDHVRAGRRPAPALGPVLDDLAAELVTEHDRLIGAAEAVIAGPRGQLGP